MGIPDITDELSVYRIDDGEKHWFIAESERDALERYAEHYGFGSIESARESFGEITIEKLPSEMPITIHLDLDDEDDPETGPVTMTAIEWVRRRACGCYLCSTVS